MNIDNFLEVMNDNGYNVKGCDLITDTNLRLFVEMAIRITQLEKRITIMENK